MKISILLPYKENFSPNYAGAVSLFVNDITNVSVFKKSTYIFGNTDSKKNSFMIFGILSAVFLAIHSILLGLDTDVKIFKFLRRIVLVGFIIFEIIAQSILVINFYKLKNQLKDLFYPNILKLKIILVSILIFVAILSIPLLIISGNIHFKHGLEWNYFIGVILFYLLNSIFWKKIF